MRGPDVGLEHVRCTSSEVMSTSHFHDKDLNQFIHSLNASKTSYEILPQTAQNIIDDSTSLHITHQTGGEQRWQ